METRHNTDTDLNAAELSQLWLAYKNASITDRVITTFLQHVKDNATKSLLVEIKDEVLRGLNQLERFLEQAGSPIPVAFTNADINLEAPRLYTDDYYLLYATQVGAFGMFAHTQATEMSIREDVRAFFSERSRTFDMINNKTITLALEKGIFPKTPTIPVLKQIDYVQKDSFMKGFFGEKRPLTALEITNLHLNLQRNKLGVYTLLGFSQVAQSDEVRNYIVKGMEIAQKHADIFRSFMKAEHIPSPEGAESMVTDEHRVAPYSDKLMMFVVTELIVISVTFYSMALTSNARHDLAAQYIKMTSEILKYAQDGAKILIENGWMEEPPRIIDREELINHKQKGD